MALKWGSVDLWNGKATYTVSRHLGEENAPKTRASRRTGTLLPNVIELLKTRLPLHVGPEDYVFMDSEGNPMTSQSLPVNFKRYFEYLKLDLFQRCTDPRL